MLVDGDGARLKSPAARGEDFDNAIALSRALAKIAACLRLFL